jgi:hypothetical protein
MASAELSRGAGKVVACPGLCEMGDLRRCEFHKARLDANAWFDPSRARDLRPAPGPQIEVPSITH